MNKEFYSICDILKPENRVDAYPLLIDLVRKKKLQLKDLMEYYKESNEDNMSEVNQRLSLVLQIMRNKVNSTKDKSLLLEKI